MTDNQRIRIIWVITAIFIVVIVAIISYSVIQFHKEESKPPIKIEPLIKKETGGCKFVYTYPNGDQQVDIFMESDTCKITLLKEENRTEICFLRGRTATTVTLCDGCTLEFVK